MARFESRPSALLSALRLPAGHMSMSCLTTSSASNTLQKLSLERERASTTSTAASKMTMLLGSKKILLRHAAYPPITNLRYASYENPSSAASHPSTASITGVFQFYGICKICI